MKVADIQVGGFYHDGKAGVREVLSIGPDGSGMDRVEYRLLAAKVTQEYSYAKQRMVSIIGSTTSCHLTSFAAWAKTVLSKDECTDLLNTMDARRIKLSPGELAFMVSALDEAGGVITKGTAITFDPTEGRAVSGLEKKGLVVRLAGEVEITILGAAWFKNMDQARAAN